MIIAGYYSLTFLFLFALLHVKLFLSLGANSFLIELTPFQKGIVASPESVSISILELNPFHSE